MPVASFLHDSGSYVSVVNAMLVHSQGTTAPGQRQMLPLTVPCFLILFLQVSEIFLFFNKGLDFKQALSNGMVTSFLPKSCKQDFGRNITILGVCLSFHQNSSRHLLAC